jgi:hypothetical protein
VAGVGIVNALEIASAFPGLDGLCRFKAWVDAPESDLVAEAAAARAGGGRRKPRAGAPVGSPAGAAAAGARVADASAASPPPAPAGKVRSPPDSAAAAGEDEAADGVGDVAAAEVEFKHKHRGKRKTWVLSESFPAQNVVDAYLHPQVDRSKQRFEWGRPDDLMLRAFCDATLGWAPNQVEPLLVSIIKEHDAHETQRTMDSFFRPQVRAVAHVMPCRASSWALFDTMPLLCCLWRACGPTGCDGAVRQSALEAPAQRHHGPHRPRGPGADAGRGAGGGAEGQAAAQAAAAA